MNDPARAPHEEPSGPAVYPYVERRRKTRPLVTALFLIGFAMLAFITGLVLFNSVLMPRVIHGVGQVEVPELSNLTFEQAQRVVGPASLKLERRGERFDPTVPRGFVLDQNPEPGTRVRRNRSVSVVVSLGEEFITVPALYGESQRSAEALLRSVGLRSGVVTRTPSDEVGEGLVAGSDPGPERVVPRDAVVHLLISSGGAEESFVMPDCAGRELENVRRQLEAFGFRVITPIGGGSRGTVVSQKPVPGARVTRGATVTLQGSGRVIR
ncbi:MAG: PASTA domain-containing protein [Candidatus Eisenbacteria bacterium]|uniref:PASTA domain-containing protein n=1 Tax=Eiseniibacteriota bacterium TaxID=2212470 RepID=A0A849SPX3_UNCEI|nr:PASTA domain-containing protein [Candidatus Eisenbacteria bacterium]